MLKTSLFLSNAGAKVQLFSDVPKKKMIFSFDGSMSICKSMVYDVVFLAEDGFRGGKNSL